MIVHLLSITGDICCYLGMFAVYDLKLFADCQICQKPQIKIGKKQPPSESDPVRTTIFRFFNNYVHKTTFYI